MRAPVLAGRLLGLGQEKGLGAAEVDQPQVAVRGQQQVLGLEVPGARIQREEAV